MRPIDADNLISVLDILSDKGGNIRYWEQLKQIVADCPTVNVVEVRQGRWIDITKDSSHPLFKCSECGDLQLEDSYYCPNCGSRMDLEGEGE